MGLACNRPTIARFRFLVISLSLLNPKPPSAAKKNRFASCDVVMFFVLFLYSRAKMTSNWIDCASDHPLRTPP